MIDSAAVRATPPAHRVFVHLGHGLDARAYHRRYLQGRETDASPYGLARAAEIGWTPVFSEDAEESAPTRFLRRALRHLLGFDLWHAWRNRARWRDCDAVWTVQDSEWLAIAALRALGRPCPPLVGNTIWLADRWSRLGPMQRALARRLARRVEVLTVHAGPVRDAARRCLPGTSPQLLLFGIPTEQFDGDAGTSAATDDEPRPLRIFAPGSDPTRDWPTLLAAFGDDPRFALVVLSEGLPAPLVAAAPANVRVTHWQGLAALKAAYIDCDLVVIPMHSNNYAGITVALEATAMGRPVLASRTGGVPTYFADDELLWAPPGDAAALRAAALAADAAMRGRLVRAAQARFAASDYSTRGMVERYRALTEPLLPTGAAVGAPRLQ